MTYRLYLLNAKQIGEMMSEENQQLAPERYKSQIEVAGALRAVEYDR
jgi:hypothetical protein